MVLNSQLFENHFEFLMTRFMRSRAARLVIISFQRAAVAPLSHGNMFNKYFISTGRVGIDVKSSNSPAFMSAAQYERSAQ